MFPSACNSYFTVVYQVCNCIMSKNNISAVQFSHSVVSDAATPGTTARQASLSITNSQSVLQLMPIESVMPSSHLILCRPLLLPPSVFPSVRVFMSLSLQQVIIFLLVKGLKCCEKYQKQRHKVSKCHWKNGTDRLAAFSLPQTFSW